MGVRAALAAVAVAAIALAAVAGAGGWLERARTLPSAADDPLLYVALGDSTVEGVGASSAGASYVSRLHERLQAVYPRAQVLNLGRGGARSADVVASQLEPAVQARPHLVTLSIGPNDITGRVPVEAYARNLETIFRRLTGETNAVVVANLLPDLAITPRFRGRDAAPVVGELTVRFNEALGRLGRRYGVELVDLYQASRAEVPGRPELIGEDGYHPSDLGYARWAELLWGGVERRRAAR